MRVFALLAVGLFSNVASASGLFKVAVTDIRISSGIPEELGAAMGVAVSEELEKMGAFEAISTEEIRQMLGFEQQRQLLGCEADTSCLVEFGGALGVDFLVVGSVLLMEKTYLIQLQLVRIAAAKVENRISRDYAGGPLGLLDDVRTASHLLVRDVLATRTGELLVTASQEGATIKVDDVTLGVTPLESPLSVAMGMHNVVLEKEGFIRFQQDVTVTKDAQLKLDATLVPSAEFIQTYRDDASMWQWAGWISTGAGVAGLVVSGVLYGVASGKDLEGRTQAFNAKAVRTQSEREEIQALQKEVANYDVGTLVAGLVGAAALGVGITILALGPDPHHYDTSITIGDGGDAGLDLSISPSPTGLLIHGRF